MNEGRWTIKMLLLKNFYHNFFTPFGYFVMLVMRALLFLLEKTQHHYFKCKSFLLKLNRLLSDSSRIFKQKEFEFYEGSVLDNNFFNF